jgi:hypothetical protein
VRSSLTDSIVFMKTSIVYISHRKDLVWLIYSLQLLFKHLRGEYEVVVRLDEDCRDIVNQWALPVRFIYLQHPWPDGYSYAMYEKLIADDYVDHNTDVIWLLDSDHMLMRPAHVDDFFDEYKPILHYHEWEHLPEEYARVAQAKWKEPTERALGVPLNRDYMSLPPMAFWMDTFLATRQRITFVNQKSLIDFGYSDIPFKAANFLDHRMTLCDYETLGLFAATFEPTRYAVRPVVKDWPFKVFWSHGEFPQEIDTLLHSA